MTHIIPRRPYSAVRPHPRQGYNSAPVADFRQAPHASLSSQIGTRGAEISERRTAKKKYNTLTCYGETVIPGDFDLNETVPFHEQLSRPLAHAASLPGAASAWRNRTGEFLSGLLFRSRRKRQSPQRHFCHERIAQELTLRPGPGLPHHRHPITTDELLAGVILVLVCMTSLVYVLWRSA